MSARSPIDDCVHCGFCLPACPTWISWNEEMDSPRGRIDLARGLRDGRIALTPTVATHFDRCLGCMACLAACPSGVRYNVIIAEARQQVEDSGRRPAMERLRRTVVFALFPYPARLKAFGAVLLLYSRSGLQWLLRHTLFKLFPRLARLEALLPQVSLRQLSSSVPERTPALGAPRARVGLLLGCVQRVFFPEVNEATARVLAAEGCEVVAPRGQGCCGALSFHSGRSGEARRMAQDLIARFEAAGMDTILVNAAGCGSHMKELGELFAGDPQWAPRAAAFAARVKDVTEFLAALPARAERHPLEKRVAYHSPCHHGHAQGIREPPRALLRSIPGLTLLELPDGEQCCGSAGIYNLVEPESAEQIGDRKVEAVLSVKPELLASGNPGCTLQIQRLLRKRGLELPALHPIEILDAAIAGRRGTG
jgi:glycolate oxidase iron-sulfur subunit